ncbi:alpha/beta hydrolase [Leptospira bandrabouensis]|uniref:alpha/beta fold hydrolase n=1 Tax=Leptospira bandrabouensis TaxID=2484903 RepID=UPI00223E0970|nr:alpha/beta fold hydrolase [Leptospira bandrabouensis]MCW7459264.1 alpha/beta hydrolase [Leptospira bandrabouensis]MCW7478303.1 alpha/beta hydrolase [Leptospira bandrabouensis]MCW7485575.1 alpha/beta hydrolase [Leptospira bandrabouensis]
MTNHQKEKKDLRIVLFLLPFFALIFCSNDSLEGEEPIQSVTLPWNQFKIHFLSNKCKDKKRLLVLVHGSPGSSSDFITYLKNKELQDQFCIFVPDRLGYGDSTNEKSFPNIFQQGNVLAKVFETYINKQSFSFEKAIFVGHSYGGPIAIVLSMAKVPIFPKNIQTILLSSPSDPNLEKLHWYNHLANIQIFQWFLPKSWIFSNEEMFTLKFDLEQLTTTLGNSSLNILSIHGENDQLVLVENVQYFTKSKLNIKHRFQILKGENHFIPWTSFAEIKSILIAEGSK